MAAMPSGSRGSPGIRRHRRPGLLSFERPAPAALRGGCRLSGPRSHLRAHLENSIAVCGVLYLNQETKGTRWMPWHLEPMKDVDGCDKPRGAADQALIRGFPNGETHPW